MNTVDNYDRITKIMQLVCEWVRLFTVDTFWFVTHTRLHVKHSLFLWKYLWVGEWVIEWVSEWVSYPWNVPTIVMSEEYIGLRWTGHFLLWWGWWWWWLRRWRWWKAQNFVSPDVDIWYRTTTQQTNLILHKLTAIQYVCILCRCLSVVSRL
jgi:hypothetical protein